MGIHELFFDVETKACNKYGEKTLVLMQVGAFFEVFNELLFRVSYFLTKSGNLQNI